MMTRDTRLISWIGAALKDFGKFPEGAKSICLAALTIAAEGGKADIAKPMHGWVRACSRLRSLSVETRSGWSKRCRSAMSCGWFMRFRRNRRTGSRLRSVKSM